MTTQKRILLAAVVLGLDVLIIILPVMAIGFIYVIFARPVWFRKLVDDIYRTH